MDQLGNSQIAEKRRHTYVLFACKGGKNEHSGSRITVDFSYEESTLENSPKRGDLRNQRERLLILKYAKGKCGRTREKEESVTDQSGHGKVSDVTTEGEAKLTLKIDSIKINIKNRDPSCLAQKYFCLTSTREFRETHRSIVDTSVMRRRQRVRFSSYASINFFSM